MPAISRNVIRHYKVKIDYEPISKNLHLYRRREVRESIEGDKVADRMVSDPTETERHGLVDDDNLILLLDGQVFEEIPLASVAILTKPWRDAYAKFGGRDLEQIRDTPEGRSLPPLPDVETLFDSYMSGKWKTSDLFRVVPGPLPYRSFDGRVLPRAFWADHGDARMHTGCLRMGESALFFMQDREDIRFYAPAEDGDVRVGAPHFRWNRIMEDDYTYTGRSYLAFYWHPRQEQIDRMAKVLDAAPHVPTDEDVWKLVFDLDLLGLRAAGGYLYDSFYLTHDLVEEARLTREASEALEQKIAALGGKDWKPAPVT
jgi:hypothetical protein